MCVAGAKAGELLLDLGDVAVAADAVRLHALVDLAEHQVLLRLAAGAGHAGLGVDDEVGDQPGSREGREGQQGRRRVAAGRPDDRGLPVAKGGEPGPVELGKAVDGLAEQVGPRMLEAVPAGIVGGVPEAEVGAEVDDRRAGGRELRDDLGGGTMGQREEDGVRVGDGRVDVEARAVEVDVGPADRLVAAAATHQPHDLDVRMARQQADELGADVAGGTDDGDPDPRPRAVRA